MEKYFVFTTPRYDEEEKKYGVQKVLLTFRGDLSKDNYVPNIRNYYPNFPGNYMRPKKESGNFRIVLACKDYNDKDGNFFHIHVALRVFKRGDSEYTKFERSRTSTAERDTITGLCNIDWNKYIQLALQELDSQNVVMEEVKPSLMSKEYEFI